MYENTHRRYHVGFAPLQVWFYIHNHQSIWEARCGRLKRPWINTATLPRFASQEFRAVTVDLIRPPEQCIACTPPWSSS
ncbi:hypothetical protein N7468_003636 [Penicillium chermesinum]|uniref:Uncharacterized protein n=1 Tax=Penicillium chermesinum TaxID=63820 RepID=A0A9W9TRZ7_9EURO|nr:uncharacterized protein N7468_003636 [Penicillium chermesinum]KAJ5239017.1 hypothetical protein N7468_003636 [Penicillium chermesinum]